ncbi:hypothetical protein GCM10010507_11970 [Streptomyces cinnamoneus]|uniref:Uncharacterized protein n=1 Tax=Streptomyces cinnamoneus TaxID=53446 RepID=A0A918WEC6_STRCJ|nr:hypothetical protein GCM10010507_11970 [Streptomyces cinnamoneus]
MTTNSEPLITDEDDACPSRLGDQVEDCEACGGSGDDCIICGGNGWTVPDHCCACASSPYCTCCPTAPPPTSAPANAPPR